MSWPNLSQLYSSWRASLTVDGANPVRAKLREIVPEYVCQIGGSDTQEEIAAVLHFTEQRARFEELETPVALGRVNFLPLFKQEDCRPALLYHPYFGDRPL